jgi:transposase-like protein
MDKTEDDVLAHMGFPNDHCQQLHSTNPLERLNGEIKRRNVVKKAEAVGDLRSLTTIASTCRTVSFSLRAVKAAD